MISSPRCPQMDRWLDDSRGLAPRCRNRPYNLITWWAWWRVMQNDYTARGAIYLLAGIFISTCLGNFLEHGITTPAVALGLFGLALFVLAHSWPKLTNSNLANSIRTVTSSSWFWIAVVASVWIYGTASSLILLAQRNELETIIREDIQPFKIALQRWVLPRRLTAEQIESIGTHLSKYSPHQMTFAVASSDSEADEYRQDIERAFMRGGWSYGPVMPKTDIPDGLSVMVRKTEESARRRSDSRNPELTTLIEQAFAAAAIRITSGSVTDKNIEQDVVCINIGRRPRSGPETPQSWPPKLGD